jgi:polyisoprenoid-binding protein YceI
LTRPTLTKRLAFLILIATAASAETAIEIDPAKTEINFTLHDMLHKFHGSFQLKRGSVHFDPDNGKAWGEIVIDVTSGETGTGIRDRRMHKEILESQKYPEAIFTPDSLQGKLEPQGQSAVDVHGALKIHGDDHELTLHFLVDGSSGQYTGSTTLAIPYVEWGMKNPSTFLLKVDSIVTVNIVVTASAHP